MALLQSKMVSFGAVSALPGSEIPVPAARSTRVSVGGADTVRFAAKHPLKNQPLAVRFAGGSDAGAIDQSLAKQGLTDLSALVKQVIPATAVLKLTKKPEAVSRSDLRELREMAPMLYELSDTELIEKVLTPKVAGSGFWIEAPNGKRYLITNNHVATALDDKFDIPLALPDSNPLSALLGVSRGRRIRLSDKVEITGELNFVRDLEAITSKREPVKMTFRVARTVDGRPALSKAKDLAVLEPIDPRTGQYQAPPPGTAVLKFADEKDWNEALHPGKPVLKVGRNGGNIASGIINAISSMGPCKKSGGCHCFITENLYVVSSLDLSHGDSGGPLVDPQARVLGVNTMTDGGHDAYNDGHGYSVAAPEVVKLLKAWGFQR